MMQDSYSAMMHRDERFFKSYGGRGSNIMPPTSYYGMPYQPPSHTMTQSDLSGLMPSTGTSGLGLDFSSVASSSSGQSSSMMSNNPVSAHTQHHTAGSSGLHMMGLNSPIPTSDPIPNASTSNQESSPQDQDIDTSHLSSPSSTSSNPSTPLDLAGDGDNKIPPKKRTHIVPDNQKDDAYWDKRKKNNESAKRSREARRMKEEQIALRVVFLEQENLQLRTEVSLLKSEIEKLRCMLYNQ